MAATKRTLLRAGSLGVICAVAGLATAHAQAPNPPPNTGPSPETAPASIAGASQQTPALNPPPAHEGASADATAIQEVVVTAQRRAESAQKVPIAITTFTATKLAEIGATSTADLPAIVPGFQVNPNGAGDVFYLRGVGDSNPAAGVESEVSTYVDGVYMPFQAGNVSGFSNITGIEVDKGPQGTLFGRNATGGVIQITTKKPSFTPSMDAAVGYANYNTVSGSFYGETGVTDKIATSLALYFDDQMDGWGKNLATGEDIFKFHDFAIRSKTIYNVTNNTSLELAVDYSTSGGNNGTDVKPAVGSNTLFNELTGQRTSVFNNFYDVDANFYPHTNTQQGGVSLKVKSDFAWGSLVSISSFRASVYALDVDYDGSPIDFFDVRVRSHEQAETQDFQLLSPKTSWLTYALGVFLYNDEGQDGPFGFGGPSGQLAFGAPPGQDFNIYSTQYDHSIAGYGQATATVLPDTRLTLGARYTVDFREIHGRTAYGTATVPGSSGAQSATFSEPTFRVALDHSFTPDILGYVSYNRGFHSGLFNLNSVGGFSPAANPAVKPETLDAYEGGFKSQLFARRFQFNASGFYYSYSNLQQEEYEGAALVTTNAASAKIKGVDVDLAWRATEQLTFTAGAEYLDATYDSYPNAPFYALAPNGALTSFAADAKGKDLVAAPPYTYTLAGAYHLPTEVGDFDTSVTLSYNNGFYVDPGNDFREPEYYLLNLSEMWKSRDGRYNASVFAKNLTGTKYDAGVNVLSPIGYVSNPGAPRTYGVRFGVHF